MIFQNLPYGSLVIRDANEIPALQKVVDRYYPNGFCNAYLSNGGKSPIHSESYDVVILQLLGVKEWLFSNGQVIMQRGMVMTVPAGTEHCTVSSGVSLHLTIRERR